MLLGGAGCVVVKLFLPSLRAAKRRQVQRSVDPVSPLEAALTLVHWRQCTGGLTHPPGHPGLRWSTLSPASRKEGELQFFLNAIFALVGVVTNKTG